MNSRPPRSDLRGRHYGRRSCEPRLKAERTAAPTNLRREKIPCQLGTGKPEVAFRGHKDRFWTRNGHGGALVADNCRDWRMAGPVMHARVIEAQRPPSASAGDGN
jgi:hypothetical protein